MKENLDFQRIQTAWTRYVAGPESVPEQIPGVRPEIVDSWRRSKGQADPFALEKTIPSDHLQALVQDNAQLIRIARPYLMNLFQYLRETKHQITIVDAHGCILDTKMCIRDRNQPAPLVYCLPFTLHGRPSYFYRGPKPGGFRRFVRGQECNSFDTRGRGL